MATHKTTWLALALAVLSLWVAALFVIVMAVIYRGSHPESLHSAYTDCAMAVFFGSPVLALISTRAVTGALRRLEHVPVIAIWTRNSSLILAGAPILFILITIAAARWDQG